ncbi:MAG: type II secretion system F family protein [Thermoprotei archaeon]|nr:type II secretion system F family protein [Thermoprotei archaeon]
MNIYSITIILLLVIFALATGYVVPERLSLIIPLAIIALAVAGTILASLAHSFETYIYDFMREQFERAGIPLGRGYPRLVVVSIIAIFMVALTLIALFFSSIIAGVYAPQALTVFLALSIILIMAGMASTLTLIIASPRLISSLRVTGALVELPFLIATLRVFSKTHLTLYDVFKLVESSAALKWWSSEVKAREAVAKARGVSLLTAISMLSEEHPSLEVRDFLKRVTIVGSYAGTIAGVVERLSEQVFGRLRSRLETLTGYMYIAVGVALASLFLVPILAATVGQVIGVKPPMVVYVTLATAAPLFLFSYMLAASLYPSGFMLNPPGTLKITYILSIAGIFSVLAYMSYTAIKGAPVNPLVPAAVIIALLMPPVVLTLSYNARVSAYDRLIKVVSDSTEMASVTGESLISVMRRIARGDRRVQRLIREVERSIVDDNYRVRLVSQAPNMLYSSYIENLVYSLRIGAPMPVFYELSAVYENLNETLKRHMSTMRGVELTIALIIGAITLFVIIMTRILRGVAEQISQSAPGSVPGTLPPMLGAFKIVITPEMMYVIAIAMIIIAIVVGSIVEKSRSGTIMTSARTILLYTLIATSGFIIALLLKL